MSTFVPGPDDVLVALKTQLEKAKELVKAANAAETAVQDAIDAAPDEVFLGIPANDPIVMFAASESERFSDRFGAAVASGNGKVHAFNSWEGGTGCGRPLKAFVVARMPRGAKGVCIRCLDGNW